jgi:hypothetical protein
MLAAAVAAAMLAAALVVLEAAALVVEILRQEPLELPIRAVALVGMAMLAGAVGLVAQELSLSEHYPQHLPLQVRQQ